MFLSPPITVAFVFITECIELNMETKIWRDEKFVREKDFRPGLEIGEKTQEVRLVKGGQEKNEYSKNDSYVGRRYRSSYGFK